MVVHVSLIHSLDKSFVQSHSFIRSTDGGLTEVYTEVIIFVHSDNGGKRQAP